MCGWGRKGGVGFFVYVFVCGLLGGGSGSVGFFGVMVVGGLSCLECKVVEWVWRLWEE